jgi:hypothetical protein
MKTLRGFIVTSIDAEFCVAIIAESHSQAKRIALCSDYFSECEWVDLRCKLMSGDFDISVLPKGEIKDQYWCLKQGIYSSIKNANCPNCKAADSFMVAYDEESGFYCDACEEDEEVGA